jgi:hypothetical protein
MLFFCLRRPVSLSMASVNVSIVAVRSRDFKPEQTRPTLFFLSLGRTNLSMNYVLVSKSALKDVEFNMPALGSMQQH